MATVEDKVAATLWPDGGPMDYLDPSGEIPAEAVPTDVTDDPENWPERPDIRDKSAYYTAYGMAWAIAKIENPFATAEELAEVAKAAAIKACQT